MLSRPRKVGKRRPAICPPAKDGERHCIWCHNVIQLGANCIQIGPNRTFAHIECSANHPAPLQYWIFDKHNGDCLGIDNKDRELFGSEISVETQDMTPAQEKAVSQWRYKPLYDGSDKRRRSGGHGYSGGDGMVDI